MQESFFRTVAPQAAGSRQSNVPEDGLAELEEPSTSVRYPGGHAPIEASQQAEGFNRSISLYWRWANGQKSRKGVLGAQNALMLQCEHWLEAADPKHRYGTNLRPYFEYWVHPEDSGDDAGAAAAAMRRSATQLDVGTPPATSYMTHAAQGPASAGNAAGPHHNGTPQPVGSQAGAGEAASVQPRRSLSAPNLQEVPGVPGAVAAAAAAAAGAAVVRGKHGVLPLEYLPQPEALGGNAADHRFFQWLDEGEGRAVDLADRGVTRRKLESERVTYLTEEERRQVEVVVVSGLLAYKVSSQLVDTRTAPAAALIHAATAPPDMQLPLAGGGAVAYDDAVVADADADGGVLGTRAATAAASARAGGQLPPGAPPAAGPAALGAPCKWIYVLDTGGHLYVHAKYRGKFHHSSFLQGGAVMSAGGIVVEDGRITKLTADSGHYRPSFESFMVTVQLLKDMGADLSATKLSAKHIRCPMPLG